MTTINDLAAFAAEKRLAFEWMGTLNAYGRTPEQRVQLDVAYLVAEREYITAERDYQTALSVMVDEHV